MSHDNVIKVIIYLFVCRCCSSFLCACALAHWLFLLFSISRHFPCFSLRITKRIARFALTQHVWKQQYMHSLSLLMYCAPHYDSGLLLLLLSYSSFAQRVYVRDFSSFFFSLSLLYSQFTVIVSLVSSL